MFRILLSWIPPLAFTLLIFFTLPYAPKWGAIIWTFNPSSIKRIIGISLFILYLSVVIYFYWKGENNKTARVIWFSLVLFSYGYLIYSIKYIIEQVHLIEYGILTIFYYLSLRKSIKDKFVFYIAWLIIFFVGMVDEWIQFYLPTRVGDLPDIYLNGVSAGLVLILIGKVFLPNHTRPPVSFRSVRILCYLSVFFLLSLGVFISTITDWGFRHKDPGVGVFYSRFTVKDLLERDKREGEKYAVAIKDFLKETGESERPSYLSNQSAVDKFKVEVLTHLSRRNYYEKKGKYWVAYKENIILASYFTESVLQSGYGWSQEKVLQIKQKMQAPPDKFYESPVSKSELIISFGPVTMWVFIFLMICSFLWIMFKQSKVAILDVKGKTDERE